MSYDLSFLSKKKSAVWSAADFASHFSSRTNYTANESEAWYENEDTGVYFSFAYGPEPEEPEILAPIESAGFHWSGFSFNMNYFRPHPFGIEAEKEITALVARFDFAVDDPQNSGMGLGAYSGEGFLRGWNAGNSFAVSAMKTQYADSLPNEIVLLPEERILALWQWNYGRRDFQAHSGEDVFIPKISFGRIGNEFATLAVWSDAIPAILPEADFLALVRQELAPKRLFRGSKPDVIFLPFAHVKEALNFAAPLKTHSLDCYRVSGSEECRRFFQNARAMGQEFKAIGFDRILDRKTFESA